MSTFSEDNYLDFEVFLDGTVIEYGNIDYITEAKNELDFLKRKLIYAEHPEEIEDIQIAIESTEQFIRIVTTLEDKDLLEYDSDYEIIDDEE